jgi:membrane-bound ClpP family serine protease
MNAIVLLLQITIGAIALGGLGLLGYIVAASHWHKRQLAVPLYCQGVAETPLALTGIVLVAGEAWLAMASQPIAAGQLIEVVGVNGVVLIVTAWPKPMVS